MTTVHQRHRQTDRQTDEQTYGRTHEGLAIAMERFALRASRGKIVLIFSAESAHDRIPKIS